MPDIPSFSGVCCVIAGRFELWLRVLAFAVFLVVAPASARAAVQITFYSHEFGANFPHAFIVLEGTDDATGERIDANYGFTATAISPAILLGPVKGEVFSRDSVRDAEYLRSSDKHFSFVLSAQEYRTVMSTVAKWRGLKQPSYDLDRQNCVHFVADVAASLGMAVEMPKSLMKKPRSYTEFLTRTNREWLLARGAILHRKASNEPRR